MAKYEDTANLILRGMDPANIAQELGNATSTIRDNLGKALFSGLITRADIAISIDRDFRARVYEKYNEYCGKLNFSRIPRKICEDMIAEKEYKENENLIDENIIRIVIDCNDFRPDLIRLVLEIESIVHSTILSVIKSKQIDWINSFPNTVVANIQRNCRDNNNIDFRRCNFVDLRTILKEKWTIFDSPILKNKNKTLFLNDLRKLNQIRNDLVHPHTQKDDYEDDYRFVRQFYSKL